MSKAQSLFDGIIHELRSSPEPLPTVKRVVDFYSMTEEQIKQQVARLEKECWVDYEVYLLPASGLRYWIITAWM